MNPILKGTIINPFIGQWEVQNFIGTWRYFKIVFVRISILKAKDDVTPRLVRITEETQSNKIENRSFFLKKLMYLTNKI